jgi:hypothetical protein
MPVQALYKYSAGMPREATILADNSLLLGYLRQERRVTPELVHAAAKERKVNLEGQEAPA